MKTKVIVSVLAVLFMMVMNACQRQDPKPKLNEKPVTYEGLMKAAIDANVNVEHATLTELNEIFIANGLRPYTEEQILQFKSELEKRGTNCNAYYLAAYLGDADGNGTLSGYDLVLISINYGVLGTYYDSYHGYRIYPTDPVTDYEIYKEGYMNYINNLFPGEYNWLDVHDRDVGSMAILGLLCP